MEVGKARYLLSQNPLAARAQVHGLGSAYLKQKLVMQTWGSAKSFLVTKSIIWSTGAAMTAAFTQHPPLTVLVIGTLVSHTGQCVVMGQ